MPRDYYYYSFRRNPNADKVRSKQVWNISKIIYLPITYLYWLVLYNRHFSKCFINIKSFHLCENRVISLFIQMNKLKYREVKLFAQEYSDKKCQSWVLKPVSFIVIFCCLLFFAVNLMDLLLLSLLLSHATIIFYWLVRITYQLPHTRLLISRVHPLCGWLVKDKLGKWPNKRTTWYYNQCQVQSRQAKNMLLECKN